MSLESSAGLHWWSLSCQPIAPSDQPQHQQQQQQQQQMGRKDGRSSWPLGWADNDGGLPDQVTCPKGAQVRTHVGPELPV